MSLSPRLSNRQSNRLDTRPRLASFLVMLGLTFGGAALAYFRIPARAVSRVWAEDGPLFLAEYLDQGPGLFTPYAGYLHLLPRTIVATVVPVFGLEAYPVAVTVACCIVLGLISALTFYCASALTTNAAARLCWASIPVLVPPGAVETLGNVANLHWYLLWLAPWVLMKSSPVLSQKILLGAVALVIGLTEIQAALFLPLIFFRLRDRNLWWAKAGLAAGTACQLFTLWRFPRFPGGTGETGDLLSVVYGYFLNSAAAIFYGSGSVITDLIQRFGAAPIVLSALPFAAAAVLTVAAGRPLHRMVGAVWLVSSMAVWAAAVIVSPAAYFHYATFESAQDWDEFFLSRYSAVPSMFLLALVPLLIAVSAERRPASGRLATLVSSSGFRGGVAGAFLILVTVHFFPLETLGSAGPEWAPQIREARQECAADPALESVRITQAPGNWFTTIDCADL